MTNHIMKLNVAAQRMCVSYHLAFNSVGDPDIGVRGAINKEMRNDYIIIDDTSWLIAGDVYVRDTHKRLTMVKDITHFYEPQDLYVMLTAQAIIAGTIVRVSLGRRCVYSIQRVSEESGFLELYNTED